MRSGEPLSGGLAIIFKLLSSRTGSLVFLIGLRRSAPDIRHGDQNSECHGGLEPKMKLLKNQRVADH